MTLTNLYLTMVVLVGPSQDSTLRPDAVVDLKTDAGVQLVQGRWRYSDASIVEVDHRNPGPDLKPSGAPNRTYDVVPHAGGADFDDSRWQVIEAGSLEERRSTGRLCCNWYRINVTIPEQVGKFATEGSTAVFEIVLDDYAEVWVNGRLPLALGETGGGVIRGWNVPTRVLLGRQLKPGTQFQLAIFGMNGPVSNPPGNFIWVRSATLDFYRGDRLQAEDVPCEVVRMDPAVDELIEVSPRMVRLATGFGFTEGPAWVDDGAEGYLLFSDPNNNTIHRLAPSGEVTVFRAKSGYTGFDIGEYRQPGSNGLALDAEGRLTICEHGNRRVTRLEKNGALTILADRYDGRRLNSPNDLVYRSDGTLYFTDPPFGLPGLHDDARREQPHFGVYCVKEGRVRLLSTDLRGPNGIALSPDERFLYVANWDEKKKVVMRYPVRPDGSLADGRTFFDMTAAPGEEALDGVKVDERGNVYVSGPGGVWILSGEGKHLGTIKGPELAANFAWGGRDGRTLFLTTRTSISMLRMKVAGHRPFAP